MGKKIAFIGAGSQTFTRNLTRDILTFPEFEDCTIALMDIDKDRLKTATKVVQKIIDTGKRPARILATMDRKEALKGADGVLATIMVGGSDPRYHDIRIPLRFGVDQNIADTRGPGGIFKFLRTLSPMMSICRDIQRYCPGAVFLNYTNPMAMLCRAMQSSFPDVNVTGLCHSVQGTAEMLARWIGAPMDEVTFVCAGINHQAFYVDYRWKGENAYPLIKKAITTHPEIYKEEIVRNEMYLHLDYYVTESSGHNSEYNAWFRKRPDLIEKYCVPGTGWNPGHSSKAWIAQYEENRKKNKMKNEDPWWKAEAKKFLAEKHIDLKRGHEYASYIFNAVFGDGTPFEFNGNVRNFGTIDNLPWGGCVEVPTVANRRGITPLRVGKLPPQLAALVSLNAQIEEMVVEGALARDRHLIQQALYFDPLTAAVCSLAEIRKMFNDLWKVNARYLHWFDKR